MSTIQKKICDKCGFECDYNDSDTWYNLVINKHNENRTNTPKEIYNCYDLCSDCFSNLDPVLMKLGFKKVVDKDNN